MGTKAEKTKRRILDAASQLFWQASYHGVNMCAISGAAGVNKASVYSYYPSKEALAVAVIQDYCERTKADLYEAVFQATPNPLERLTQIYQRIYQSTQAACVGGSTCPGCPFINFAIEMSTQSEPMRQEVERCFDQFAHYYRLLVQDARKQGIGTAVLTEEQAVTALMSNLHGATVAAKISNQPDLILEHLVFAHQILER